MNNDFGVGAISYDKDVFVIATLSTRPGVLRLENFYQSQMRENLMHETNIIYVALDFFGNLGACVVADGTIIRVFDSRTLDVMHDFVRGSSAAIISSMAFSPDFSYLIAASNKSTIHL